MNNKNNHVRIIKVRKISVIITAIIVSLFAIIYFSLFHYAGFSVDDYKSYISWFEQLGETPEYTAQISNRISAINAAEQAWDSEFDIGKCIYNMYYDKENDCWLIEGKSIDYINPLNLFKSMSGGVKRAIIQSDGKILALILDM